MALDVLTFVVLIVLVVCAAAAAVKIAAWPGKIASDRGHPQSDAIRVCGWLGLLTLGLLWPLALIWAYTRPREAVSQESIDAIHQRLERLEGATTGEDRP